MTWNNRGDWHTDHYIPCKAFNFNNKLEIKICFWYKNLQPLWENENCSKGDYYEEEDKLKLIEDYKKYIENSDKENKDELLEQLNEMILISCTKIAEQ